MTNPLQPGHIKLECYDDNGEMYLADGWLTYRNGCAALEVLDESTVHIVDSVGGSWTPEPKDEASLSDEKRAHLEQARRWQLQQAPKEEP